MACCKGLPVYFLAEAEFLNLTYICPSKTESSQVCFLCVKKGVEMSFLRCFSPFLKLKTCQNFLAICEHAYFPMTNPKMLIFSQKEDPSKASARWHDALGRKTCFAPKISSSTVSLSITCVPHLMFQRS